MSEAELLSIAIVGLLFGPIMAKWPYKLARFSEVLDAIGRKPSGRVEPADWNVILTQVFGVGLTIAGLLAAAVYVS